MPAISTYYRALHSGIVAEMEMLFTVENVGLKLKCLGSLCRSRQRHSQLQCREQAVFYAHLWTVVKGCHSSQFEVLR